MLCDCLNQRAVAIKHPIHVADVPSAVWPTQNLWISVVAVSPAQASVVVDVPRALFEVTHQPSPLKDLRQNVGSLFTRQVHTTELSYRVIAILDKHLFIQSLCFVNANRGVNTNISC